MKLFATALLILVALAFVLPTPSFASDPIFVGPTPALVYSAPTLTPSPLPTQPVRISYPTPTPSYSTMTRSVNYNRVLNGGFENGTLPWNLDSDGSSNANLISATYVPHSGSYSASLDSYGRTDRISQVITVPTNGTLTFWWWMRTYPNPTYSTSIQPPPFAVDYLDVTLFNSNGVPVAGLSEINNLRVQGVWQQETLTLSAYAGQTLRLEFKAWNITFNSTDLSDATVFLIDDVILN